VLESHCTHALFVQCGLAVGQSVSPRHCTHPGVAIIPQRTAPGPASPPLAASLDAPLELPLELPPDEPLELPLELPPDEPLDMPLEEPLPEDPLDDPDPPSGLVVVLPPLQPTPTAMAAAIARPRQVFNDDMACLTSLSGSFMAGALASSPAGATGLPDRRSVPAPISAMIKPKRATRLEIDRQNECLSPPQCELM
jgi:hypothetical protein